MPNGCTALSHYGFFLDDNDPTPGTVAHSWDGGDYCTHPRLSDDEKRDRRALLVAARDAFLLQKRRERTGSAVPP
jgi:hypothetical protein